MVLQRKRHIDTPSRCRCQRQCAHGRTKTVPCQRATANSEDEARGPALWERSYRMPEAGNNGHDWHVDLPT